MKNFTLTLASICIILPATSMLASAESLEQTMSDYQHRVDQYSSFGRSISPPPSTYIPETYAPVQQPYHYQTLDGKSGDAYLTPYN